MKARDDASVPFRVFGNAFFRLYLRIRVTQDARGFASRGVKRRVLLRRVETVCVSARFARSRASRRAFSTRHDQNTDSVGSCLGAICSMKPS